MYKQRPTSLIYKLKSCKSSWQIFKYVISFYRDKYTFITIQKAKFKFRFLRSLRVSCQNLAGGPGGTILLPSHEVCIPTLPSTHFPTHKGSARPGVNTPAWSSSRHICISNGLWNQRVCTPATTACPKEKLNGRGSSRSWSQYLGLLNRKSHGSRYPELSLEMRIRIPGRQEPWAPRTPHLLGRKEVIGGHSKASPEAKSCLVLRVTLLKSLEIPVIIPSSPGNQCPQKYWS